MSRSQVRRSRRLFVPVISAAVLALAFSAPMASAEVVIKKGVNDGTLDGESRADAAQCAMYKEWSSTEAKKGNTTGATYWKNLADRRGCRWAERLAVEQSIREASSAPQPVGVSPGVSPGPTSTGLESPRIVGFGPGLF